MLVLLKGSLQIGDTGIHGVGIGRAHHEVRAYPTFAEKGVASNLTGIMRLFRGAQDVSHFAFRNPAADLARQERQAALQLAGKALQHACGDVRNTRHDEDVAMPDSRRARHAVLDKLRPFRHARHAKPCLGQSATAFIIALKRHLRARMNHHVDAQRHGNGIHCDVVVGRTDAACGEKIIVARSQQVHGFHDRVLIVRNDAYFLQADALHVQPAGDLRDVLVLRTP